MLYNQAKKVYTTLYIFKISIKTGHQRLTPVILATQEAEVKRIMVQSQPWANSSPDPISKNPSQKRAERVAEGAGSEFTSQYHQKSQSINEIK
jgi:hypothetical protein